MFTQLRIAVVLFLVLTVLTGVAYPLLITGISQAVFPHKANGSLIVRDGKTIGSELIGQQFDNPRYFWGRPSATAPMAYNAAASTGSNYGPTNPAQLDAVRGRLEVIRKAHTDQQAAVPVELVTASGSGLDPEISPAAAEYQVNRLAKARGVSADRIRTLIAENVQGRTFGILGEPRVNVVQLNLALDQSDKGAP